MGELGLGGGVVGAEAEGVAVGGGGFGVAAGSQVQGAEVVVGGGVVGEAGGQIPQRLLRLVGRAVLEEVLAAGVQGVAVGGAAAHGYGEKTEGPRGVLAFRRDPGLEDQGFDSQGVGGIAGGHLTGELVGLVQAVLE